jgi:hypothetical protein
MTDCSPADGIDAAPKKEELSNKTTPAANARGRRRNLLVRRLSRERLFLARSRNIAVQQVVES